MLELFMWWVGKCIYIPVQYKKCLIGGKFKNHYSWFSVHVT